MTNWDIRFLQLAQQVAGWSKDPARKVGCVLVEPGFHEFTVGYNGFPRGVEDKVERLANTEVKSSMMVHAELNAILNRRGDVSGWHAYVTAPPCVDCCKALIQAGISSVMCPELDQTSKWYDSQQFGLNLLLESAVCIGHYETIK